MKWLYRCFDKGEKAIFRVVDNETLIIYLDRRPNNEEVVSILNETGTFIWQLLDGTKTVEEIIKKVCDEFEVSYKKAQKEVINFLSELLKKDLVTISNTLRKK